MKNKRMISILMVIVLLTLQTVIVQARENETEKRISGAITEVFINPLYAGIIKTSDLLEPETAIASTYAEEEYLTSTEACAEQIREKMKQREETIVVYYQASEYSKQALVDMINQAVAHTGDPKEGDYLKWQYGGIKSSTQYYVSDDVTYMTISFAVTYYTTSEQENVVDEKIEEILSELKIADKNDYEKIASIYDYICSHVVYDQEHVGNSEYKLQFTAYAAVVDEKAVCQGYALLLYRMMLEANVDSRLIPGTGNGEAHGWNIVKLDGQYYNVDSTWDAGKTEYKFFLKCEKTFENHVRDDEYSTNEFQEAYPMAEEDYVNRIVNLEAPTIVSVYSRNQTSVKVTWDMKEEADGYELYRAEEIESDTANWNLVKTIRKESMESFMKDGNIQYTNQGLEIGKTYYYKVRAYRLKEETLVDSEENRTYSDFSEVSYMPAAVVYDKVYSNSTSRIRMIWKQVNGAHGYQILRKEAGAADDTYKLIKTLGDRDNVLTNNQGSTTAYSNTGLETGTHYTYKMRAFSIPKEGTKIFGAYSDEFTVAVMPEAPTLSGDSNKNGRVELNWNAVNGAAGYQIWMAEAENSNYSIIKMIGEKDITSYTKQGLERKKNYYFKIRAYTEVGGKKTFGDYSSVVGVEVK